MKAIVATSIGKLELLERDRPVPGKNQVMLEVKAVGLCQTDLDTLDGLCAEKGWELPRVLGHEISGVVSALGEGVSGLSVGQRVAIDPVWSCGDCFYCKRGTLGCENGRLIGGSADGGFQEYVCVPAQNCKPIPDSLPFEIAAIIEPLSCVLTAYRKSSLRPGDVAVVNGPGIGGLCFVQLAKNSGARVILVGTKDERLELGKKLGADITVNIGRENPLDIVLRETGGRGAEVYFEASGNGGVLDAAMDMTGISGSIIAYGIPRLPIDGFDLQKLILKDQSLISGVGPWQAFDEAVELVKDGKVKLDDFLTHTFAPEQTAEAFELVRSRMPGLLKAAVLW